MKCKVIPAVGDWYFVVKSNEGYLHKGQAIIGWAVEELFEEDDDMDIETITPYVTPIGISNNKFYWGFLRPDGVVETDCGLVFDNINDANDFNRKSEDEKPKLVSKIKEILSNK